MNIYLYPPQHTHIFHMGKFFKNPKTQKKISLKKVWLSKSIYIYLSSNKGYMITEKIQIQTNYFRTKEIEIIKEELYVDTMKMAAAQSNIAKNEYDDCVVRAFMAALDISYDQAHAWVKKYMKRENRKGTYTGQAVKSVEGKTKNGYKINFIGLNPSKKYWEKVIGSNKVLVNPKYKKQTGYTLKSFMENNPVGRFVLIVQGHAVAVVNGVLYGNTNENRHGLYRSVYFGWELKTVK